MGFRCYCYYCIFILYLVGEGGDGDPLPGPCDEGRGSGREVRGVERAARHVPQQHRLQRHAVRQQRLGRGGVSPAGAQVLAKVHNLTWGHS